MIYRFKELVLATGEATGRVEEYQADSITAAAQACLYTQQLANGQAAIGPTGLVIYPAGAGGPTAWVLVSTTQYR